MDTAKLITTNNRRNHALQDNYTVHENETSNKKVLFKETNLLCDIEIPISVFIGL